MHITPLDISNKTFSKAFRGYHCKDVENFLEGISQEFELAYTENFDLREKTKELESEINRYRLLEGTLQQTLILAQQTAEELKNAARHEADLIIREAEQEKLSKLSEARENWEELQEEIIALARKRDIFRIQLKSFLLAHLDLDARQEGDAGIA